VGDQIIIVNASEVLESVRHIPTGDIRNFYLAIYLRTNAAGTFKGVPQYMIVDSNFTDCTDFSD
jgi:hypothetical protein